MIRRPISQRFVEAVRSGRKTTTIRPGPWPLNRPIMIYHWSGKAYASPQVEVCAVVVVAVGDIVISHGERAEMVYDLHLDIGAGPLHLCEGFHSRAEMDEWFFPKVKPGHELARSIMKFRLATPEELAGETK